MVVLSVILVLKEFRAHITGQELIELKCSATLMMRSLDMRLLLTVQLGHALG